MVNEISQEFDPNLDIPFGLANAHVTSDAPASEVIEGSDEEIDIQTETWDDDESELDEDSTEDELEVPSNIQIISQVVRTAPDGRQVVDVVLDVEEVEGATNYEVHITK